MTIALLPVQRAHVGALIDLRIATGQEHFVASNAITLAQAAYEPETFVFGIWADQELVGLLAAIDCRNYDELEDGDDPNSAFLWRLMIGAGFQRKGYGREALGCIRAWARDLGLLKLVTSAVPENDGAIALYEGFGLDAALPFYERLGGSNRAG